MPVVFASGITKASGIVPASGLVAASGLVFPGRTPTNVIDKFTWDASYECQDATTTTWPPAEDGGVTLTSTANATLGQSTQAWSNLPARFIDQAINPPATEGMGNALFDWQDSEFHMRAILDIGAATISDRIMRYIVSGVQLAEIRLTSTVAIVFNVRNDASGGNYFATAAGAGFPTNGLLIDWILSGDQMFIYINGTDYSPAANPGGPVDFANGPDQFDLMGLSTGNVTEGVHVFYGWRWGQTISLAEHQADAAELAPPNVIDKYVWSTAYDSKDVSGTSWPELNNRSGYELTSGLAANTGISTAGLQDVGIGADRVNQAVTPGGASGAYTVANTFDWENQVFHCRTIIDFAAVLAGNRACRFLISVNNLFEIRWLTGTQLTHSARTDVVNCQALLDPWPTTWALADFNVNGTTLELFVNGVSIAPAACPIVPDFTGLGSFGFMGLENGTNSPSGAYLFIGFRYGENITFAEHEFDVSLLGL